MGRDGFAWFALVVSALALSFASGCGGGAGLPAASCPEIAALIGATT
jgi:hypothetical protein